MHDAQNMRGGGKRGADRQTELIAIMLLMIRKPERVSFFAFLFCIPFCVRVCARAHAWEKEEEGQN